MSAALAGLAGGMKALVFQFATLTDVAWQMSGEVILMTLLGGIGTMIGPIFGAGLIVALQNYLATSDFPVTIITGVVFMVCVLVFRRGIVGEFYASWLGRKLGFELTSRSTSKHLIATCSVILITHVHAIEPGQVVNEKDVLRGKIWRQFDYIVIGAGTCRMRSGQPAFGRSEQRVFCCWKPAAATIITGSTFPSAISIASTIRAPTGASSTSQRRRAERPRAGISARQGAWRLFLDQRHDLYARTGAAIMTNGGRWDVTAGAGTMFCRFSNNPRTFTRLPTTCTAPAANGGSKRARVRWAVLEAFQQAANRSGHSRNTRFQSRQQ